MPLYQNTILKKHIALNSEKISAAYKKLVDYFHNPEIQENIRKSKEEEWQEGFMRALFVNVFDYTFKPDPKYNLISEKKNETDGKKADGAILVNDEVRAVIELKSTKTTDLKQIETQAFEYKNNHRKTAYVITSNFEKLRFYIENTIDYKEFNLFTLTQDEFAVLWICLAYENIAKDLPKQLKSESAYKEEEITKKFYADYSAFKRDLFDDIEKGNTSIDKLLLFRKTQKLLDRFLFIFFAEDKGLLPPNSMKQLIEQWEHRKEDYLSEQQSLYDRFKRYFHFLNIGREPTEGKGEIFAYNGGLFQPDEILDAIRIPNDFILRLYITKIAAYDFDTEVDVNILGHIFEHSLTEIEEITNELITGEKQISKRKKDGVFYTPRYITQYIVENTIGKLCADKRKELNIDESKYYTDENRSESLISELEKNLYDYRSWLLSVTICDPACGSGAFLNAALDFLIAEHRLIDEMYAKIKGIQCQYTDNIANIILENNLFGVDINDESVEIAKLALWLRTATPHRKLNSLSENIKCGNSLISPTTASHSVRNASLGKTNVNPDNLHPVGDASLGKKTMHTATPHPVRDASLQDAETDTNNTLLPSETSLTGCDSPLEFDKAFDWHKEFPQVFEKGGFDVVIGNPPYVHLENIREESEKLATQNYQTYDKRGDLYALFVERGFSILKESGYISYIMPNKWLQAGYGKSLRGYFLSKKIVRLIDFGDIQIFEGATTYPCIFIYQNEDSNIVKLAKSMTASQDKLDKMFEPTKKLQKALESSMKVAEIGKSFTAIIDEATKSATRMQSALDKALEPTRKLQEQLFKVSSLSSLLNTDFYTAVEKTEEEVDANDFSSDTWVLQQKDNQLLERFKNENITLEKFINGQSYRGVLTGLTEAFLIDEETKTQLIEKDRNSEKLIKPFLLGRDVKAYTSGNNENYLLLVPKGFTKSLTNDIDTENSTWDYFSKNYPAVANHLLVYKVKAEKRTDKGDYYWELRACDYYDKFAKPKIMYQAFQVKPCFIYDENGLYCNNSMWFIPTDSKALLAVLNSKMGWWLISKYCTQIQNGYQLIWKYFGQIPIPNKLPEDLEILAVKMLSLNSELQTKRQTFLRRLTDNFTISTKKERKSLVITGALERFNELSFKQFLAELKKQKVTLSLKEQVEWELFFNEYKQECCNLVRQINETDKEIDGLVYRLYGLTEEDIKIIEQ